MFRDRIDPVAQRLIDEFAIYLRDYSEEFAIEQFDRLDRILSLNLQESPLRALTSSRSPRAPARHRSRRRPRTGPAEHNLHSARTRPAVQCNKVFMTSPVTGSSSERYVEAINEIRSILDTRCTDFAVTLCLSLKPKDA